MIALSLLLTVISLFTFWLVVPLFVLPPLAFCCGYKAYVAWRGQAIQPVVTEKLLWMAPMLLAVAAFVFELYVMNTEYRV